MTRQKNRPPCLQIRRGLGSSIRAVLHGLLQGLDLALQFRNLCGRFSMLLLVSFQIHLCGDRRGVCFPEGIPVMFIGGLGGFYLKAQGFLTSFRLFQPASMRISSGRVLPSAV